MKASPLIDAIVEAHRQRRALVMGVLNVTPDSFSDGGRYTQHSLAVEHALEMCDAGARIIDIGGESTRPGAIAVDVDEELARVIPVIKGLRARTDCFISVDTSKPEVMRRALDVGADLINDVRALQAPGAIDVVAKARAPVVLMHMQGQPRTMQDNPSYQDVVSEVRAYLIQRAQACIAGGIAERLICFDPGFGFGKTLAHNVSLLARLNEICELGFPVLAGLSRKSMLGKLTGRDSADERISASVSAALLAAQKGAAIVRVHDVAQTVDALKIWYAVDDDGANKDHD